MRTIFAVAAVVLFIAAPPAQVTLARNGLQQPSDTTSGTGDIPGATPSVASPVQPSQSHDRLFVAIFDCSWKNASKGPSQPTTVRQIYEQLERREDTLGDQVHAEYIVTDCARDNWYSDPTHGRAVITARVAEMYRRLGKQSRHWWGENPLAEIGLLSLGGSWGGVQAAEFVVEVGSRGIRSSAGGGVFTLPGLPEQVFRTAYTGVYIPPALITQALAVLDPVGVLPAPLVWPDSLRTGVQFTALDEHRTNFKSVQIFAQGKSPDGRFIGLSLPGSSSDISGGYKRNGLSIRTANILIGYINRLSEVPLLQQQPEPTDPQMNVIHHPGGDGA